jgi:sugar phosphate isomerase/epimerase
MKKEGPSMNMIRIGTLLDGSKAPMQIKKLEGLGFESYSITFWQKLDGVDLKILAEQVKEAIGDQDIVISTIGIFTNPLMDTAAGEQARADWAKLIDAAHLFGTDIVSGFTGRVVDAPLDQSIPAYAKVFGELGRRAQDNGVRLAFENCDMDGNWKHGDWNIAHNPTMWEMMFNALPLDNIGLEWEPCHQMVQLIDPIPQLRKWAKKIFHMHGKDATVAWDIVREYGIITNKQFAWHRTPGFGDSNWSDIITILRQNDYQGTIDIEGYHDPVYRGDLELTGQLHGLKYLKQCRGGEFTPNRF